MESTSAANTITSTSGDITFNYGTGGNGFIDVSAIDTVSAFTLSGASLDNWGYCSCKFICTQGININLGGMSGGELQISAVESDGAFVLNAGAQVTLRLTSLSASANNCYHTWFAVSRQLMAKGIFYSTDSFTLAGGSYRERFDRS